jgi:membrane-associated phospholipid phosphatase
MPSDAAALTAWVEWLGAHALALYGAMLVVLLVSATAAWWLARRYTIPRDTSALPPGAYLLIRLCVGFAIVVGAAAIFAEAAEVLGSSADARRAGELDQVFSNAVRRGIGPVAFQFFSTVTHLADTATLTALSIAGALALLWLGRRWLALAFAGAIGGNALLNITLKGIFERARPLHDQAEELARGFSFPSGHSSGAVVAYGMLAYVLIRCLNPAQNPGRAERLKLSLVLAATALAFTIGCSRVFIQAHFATDVLAGFASGSAWLAVCIGSAEWLRHYRRAQTKS